MVDRPRACTGRRDLPKLKPDIVILYTGINEQADAQLLQAEGVSLERALKEGERRLFTRNLDQARWLKRNSMIVRFLDYDGIADRLFAAGHALSDTGPVAVAPSTDPGINPVVAENFDRTLREFIELIRKNGANPVYVIVSSLPELAPTSGSALFPSGTEVARSIDVLVINSNDVVAAYRATNATSSRTRRSLVGSGRGAARRFH